MYLHKYICWSVRSRRRSPHAKAGLSVRWLPGSGPGLGSGVCDGLGRFTGCCVWLRRVMREQGAELVEQLLRTQRLKQSSLVLLLRLHVTCPVRILDEHIGIDTHVHVSVWMDTRHSQSQHPHTHPLIHPGGAQDGSAVRAHEQMRRAIAKHRRWQFQGARWWASMC